MSDELKFQREHRYYVVKRKHLSEEQEARLILLLSDFDLPPLRCAVVEDDWPEYETVWQMIEARCTGNIYPDTRTFEDGLEAAAAYVETYNPQRADAIRNLKGQNND